MRASVVVYLRVVVYLLGIAAEELDSLQLTTSIFIAEVPISLDDAGFAVPDPRADLSLRSAAEERLANKEVAE